jgi:hypothetical protein
MSDLEFLETIAALSLLSHDIQNQINPLSIFSKSPLVQLSPALIWSNSKLSSLKNWPKGPALTESRYRARGLHIQYGACICFQWPCWSIRLFSWAVGRSHHNRCLWVNIMLIRNNFPKFGIDLCRLSALDMYGISQPRFEFKATDLLTWK